MYQIRVKGQLDARWSAAAFSGFTLTHTPDGDTLLTAADQSALHGALARCRDLGITLVSVNPVSGESPVANDNLHSALVQTESGRPQPSVLSSTGKENRTMSSNRITTEASDVINARAEDIYAVLRDYRVGHPAIIPRPPFTSLTVEKGGVGAGSIVLTDMIVWGRKFHYRQQVSEPEPGRILVETSTDIDQATRFTLEPINGGGQTRVTISTYIPGNGGLFGWLERKMTIPVIQRIYLKELRQLDDYMQTRKVSAS